MEGRAARRRPRAFARRGRGRRGSARRMSRPTPIQSVAIDLARADGQALLRRMVPQADSSTISGPG